MKVDFRFHCFGCGADGDVIDFAAKLFQLSLRQAAEKLATDFGLSATDNFQPLPCKPVEKPLSPKEQFYKIMECTDRETAKKLMSDWILFAQNSEILEYGECTKTLANWRTGILNSFDVPYSNGFTEGCNNKIKVLKRNAYGYRNFERFRKRILHCFSYKNIIAAQS